MFSDVERMETLIKDILHFQEVKKGKTIVRRTEEYDQGYKIKM